MGPNTKTIQIPRHCLGQITCRANADYVQTARLEWTDDTGQKHACELTGRGEGKELLLSGDGKTMAPLRPSKNDYSVTATFTFDKEPGPERGLSPVVCEPTSKDSSDGRRTRIEIRTEDGTDGDDNDTWLTIELLKNVDPAARSHAQIDPSDRNFMLLELRDENRLLIATGIIVSSKYTPQNSNDFQQKTEYWYLGPDLRQDYSTYGKTSLQIDVSKTDDRPAQTPAAAILIRAENVTWFTVENGGPDLTDAGGKFGVSVNVEGIAQNNPQLHVFWYNLAAKNLSLSGQPSWSMGRPPSGTTTWHVAE